jgi:hypothetical protein
MATATANVNAITSVQVTLDRSATLRIATSDVQF